MDTRYVVTAVAGLVAVSLIYSFSRRIRKRPPGPRQLPIIGNAHQLPVQTPWMTFSEWARVYGDLIFLNIMGQPAVLVSSRKIASDLMEKRAIIYSDRPYMEMANLCGYNEQFVLLPYGEQWRQQRRFMAQDFTQNNVRRYASLQEREAYILVRNLLKDPASLQSELRLRIGAIILRVTYGYHVQAKDDPFLVGGLTSLGNFSKVTTPGTFLVDSIPSLKYLRRWMPGSGFLKTADEYYKVVWDAAWDPYLWCKENIVTGKCLMPNICGENIQKGNLSKADEINLVWASLTTLEGGLDTSISTALTFYMCMILNPEVQRKAQKELDSVIGGDRLPMISDRDDLPYLRSVVAEAYRFAPAVPLGVPHASNQDDVYEGYFLPKGTWIMPNIWHMLHDPNIYPNPMVFNPDRFNGDDDKMERVKDLVFGFGRRFCPGRFFSGQTFFSLVATTLATCDILPGLDKDGKEVLPDTNAFTPGTITFPEPFTLRLRIRSRQAADLLAEISDEIE